MERNVFCHITGKKFIFNKEYFTKKVSEYGDVETLRKFFITRKAKSLLSRGYTVEEIRKMLGVDEQNLQPTTSSSILELVSFYKLRANNTSSRSDFNPHENKTDPEVTTFINNIKSDHEKKIHITDRE